MISRRSIVTSAGSSLAATGVALAASSAIPTASAQAAATATPDWVNVVTVGADNTGAHDSTSFIATAITQAGNGIVYFPAGTYLVSGLISTGANCSFVGDGSSSTTITTNNPSSGILSLTGFGNRVQDLNFQASVVQSGGYFITMGGTGQVVERVTMNNFSSGINFTGNTGTIVGVSMAQTGGVLPSSLGYGININNNNGGGILWMDRILMNGEHAGGGASYAAAGININACPNVLISNSEIISMGQQLAMYTAVGGIIDSVWAINTGFDNGAGSPSNSGIVISSAGSVQRCKFTNCWTSSHPSQAFLIQTSGSGVVQAITISSHESYGNTGPGLQVLGNVSGLIVNGSTFAQNGYGILIGAGVSDFTLEGNQCGAYGGWAGNSVNGILVSSGASNRYIVTNNRLTGNGGTPLVDSGSGTSKVVSNNFS
jgi:hypothetical protein